MEMTLTHALLLRLVRWGTCLLLGFLLVPQGAHAQTHVKKYSVRDGKMLMELSQNLPLATLDSFMVQYNLSDVALKRLFISQQDDSLKAQGWQVERDATKQVFLISKGLAGFGSINNPADRMRMTGRQAEAHSTFEAINANVQFGYNRFKNKAPFMVRDSVVTFYLRNSHQVKKAFLAGTFNNWSPTSLPMQKTDSGWVTQVKLLPGKHWYKFITDGNWGLDPDNLAREDDGQGNTNSVFFAPNHVFKISGHPSAKRVYLAGSFNNWRERDLLMTKTATGWQFPVYLNQGTHLYKFIIDGKWYLDAANPERLPNEHGDFNSVVRLGIPYVFKLAGFQEAQRVVLAGTFNDWREQELFMQKTATGWELPYTLGPGAHEYKFIVDGKWMMDPANPAPGNSRDGNSYLILQPNHTFTLQGHANAREVFVAGDFNDWNPSSRPMRKVGNAWQLPVRLPAGKNRYKFVVDGKWILDPGNRLWEQNEHQTGNSIIWIELAH
ncbi:hypothetical protein [Nibribacter koreensis]|uniref:AMP-activated protein kinase glycogen-binding domain-containing protein n=1 Tax=Nibribacter koreensis TaxID=1084519 RepID=A0ABP8F7M1_9BACT